MNVRLAGSDRALASCRSSSAPIVTSAVGWVLSTTVNVAVPPASVVVSPAVGVTVMPAASLSRVGDRDVGGVDPVVDRVASLVAAAVTIV